MLAKGWTTFMPQKEGDLTEFFSKKENAIALVSVLILHWLIGIIMFFD
jgi:hypothetical protein